MKFAIAIIFTLALAMGVQSSIIPWGGHASVAVHATNPWATHLGAPWGGHIVADPWAGALIAGPAVVNSWHNDLGLHAGLGHHAAAVVVAPAHEGTYVAKTRGAVHAAPLAGHLNSAASINLAPAPGTI